MQFRPRYLASPIQKDLENQKMVFLGGPRQVGKTTLALSLLGPDATETHPAYLNWDAISNRKAIRQQHLPSHQPTVIYDEIHKYARWRNLIKGLYDTHKSKVRIIVTGSARLDYYRKGGDSLQGRYHYFRLHPLSIGEVGEGAVDKLMQLGGFPEPFFSGSERTLRRWQNARIERVVYEDLRDLEKVRELSLLEHLVDALPSRVGSPLSIQSLAEDLSVAFRTIDRWIEMLERLYVCFRISPYGAPKIRAVKKERKLYFWDWSMVPDMGARFENMIASHLLKYCHFIEDTEGYRMDLRFIRDRDGREVDFVVLKEGKPLFAVECKSGERCISSHTRYFRERTSIPQFFQVHRATQDFGNQDTDTRVLPIATFSRELGLP